MNALSNMSAHELEKLIKSAQSELDKKSNQILKVIEDSEIYDFDADNQSSHVKVFFKGKKSLIARLNTIAPNFEKKIAALHSQADRCKIAAELFDEVKDSSIMNVDIRVPSDYLDGCLTTSTDPMLPGRVDVTVDIFGAYCKITARKTSNRPIDFAKVRLNDTSRDRLGLAVLRDYRQNAFIPEIFYEEICYPEASNFVKNLSNRIHQIVEAVDLGSIQLNLN